MRGLVVPALLLAALPASSEDSLPAPMSVDELRATDFDTTLVRERDLEAGQGFTAYLVSYEHAGLKLHAMVAVPTSEEPAAGFPIVIANHGYVPDPTRYGVTSEGVDARPGDYYRSVPALFASRGFLTVIPDYRGHNSSEGLEFIDPQDEHSASYFAEDVVALMSAIDQLESGDADNVFVWSHSMGGSVSMRALLATDIVRASSFWSTMNVDELAPRFGELDGPVIVHHAEGDESTPVSNSETLAAELAEAGRLEVLLRYPEADHFFADERREAAADVDARFFLNHLQRDRHGQRAPRTGGTDPGQ